MSKQRSSSISGLCVPAKKMAVYINGYNAGTFSGDSDEEKNRLDSNILPTEDDLTTPDWWKRGVHSLEFPAEKLWLGENFIRLTYSADAPQTREKLQVLWPEIQIRYQ